MQNLRATRVSGLLVSCFGKTKATALNNVDKETSEE